MKPLIRRVAVRIIVTARNKVDSLVSSPVIKHERTDKVLLLFRRNHALANRRAAAERNDLNMLSLDLYNALRPHLRAKSDSHIAHLFGVFSLLLCVRSLVKEPVGLF